MDQDQHNIFESYNEGKARDMGKWLRGKYDKLKDTKDDFVDGLKGDDEQPVKRRPAPTLPNLPRQLAPTDGKVDNFKQLEPISANNPIARVLRGQEPESKPASKPAPAPAPKPEPTPEPETKSEPPKSTEKEEQPDVAPEKVPDSEKTPTFKDFVASQDSDSHDSMGAIKSMIDARRMFPKLREAIANPPGESRVDVIKTLIDPDMKTLNTPFGNIDLTSPGIDKQNAHTHNNLAANYFSSMIGEDPNREREFGSAGIPPDKKKFVPLKTTTVVDLKYIWLSYMYISRDNGTGTHGVVKALGDRDSPGLFNKVNAAYSLMNALLLTGMDTSQQELRKIQDHYGFSNTDDMFEKIANDAGYKNVNINNAGYKFDPKHFEGN